MVVHISLFYLKDSADADKIVAALNEVPAKNPAILTSQVGPNVAVPAPVGGPDFADVAQVITFATPEDAEAYPMSQAHLDLLERSAGLVERVSCAEFVV